MTFQSHNPATGELIGTDPEHDEAKTNARVQQAWEGRLRWSRTPLHERRAYLVRLADLLDGRAYGRLITAEMGKPLPDAIAEVKKSAPLVGPDRKPAATLGRTGSRRLIALTASGATAVGRPPHGRSS
jgi:acyl-CoA reductase-like NAD-dependent aldehyde dehydrogenase